MEYASDSESGSGSCSDEPSPPTCWDLLGNCLDRIQSMGDVAAMKRYQLAPNPVLQVGDEIIPLPLTNHGVELIKKLGRQAPFGKGSRTVVDLTVRRTWELSVDECDIRNPNWGSFLQTIVNDVCSGELGIEGRIAAHLYKVLLYEPGSFFTAHKDSQKEDGMIATLVICLPSEYEGGEVHLSHAGQHQTFDASESSLFDTTALAWYSDVTHEVKKVVSGHRLVLTYNIAHEAGSKYSAGAFDQQLDTVNSALTQCRLQDPHFVRKIYPLDHKYSRAGLSLRDLKGRDRAVCQSLYKLCSQNGFYLFLSHMTKAKIKYSDESEKEDKVAMSLDVIHEPNGDMLAQRIRFNKEQLIKNPYYGDRTEDSFEESEYLGNESESILYEYHDSAAIICPKNHLGTFLRSGCINMENVMLIAMRDIEENPNASGDYFAILESIAKYMPTRAEIPRNYTTMIEWAWKHDHQSLYTMSVLGSIPDRLEVGMKTVAKIINADISEANPQTVVQWDKYLGGVIDGISSLTDLAQCLTTLEDTVIDSLKPKFSRWKIATERRRFYAKTILDTSDEPFIISRLNNPEWLTNCLVPALITRGDKTLIRSVVKILLENGPKAIRTNPVDAASKIMQSACSRVALDPSSDFEGDRWTFFSSPAGCFLDILERTLLHGLKSIAANLLDATWTNINACHKDEDTTPLKSYYKRIIECFLHRLGQILQGYKVSHLDSTRQIFTLLTRRGLYADVPSYPKKLPGWSHKPRGCGCKDCDKLDDFLRAEDVSEFECKEPPYHIRNDRLPSSIFKLEFDPLSDTLKISKLQGKEFEDDISKYNWKVADLEERLKILRNEYMKELMGDAVYRELVMLEGVKGSKGAEKLTSADAKAQAQVPTPAPTRVLRPRRNY
ncbi:hypothetical protein FHL15_007444 [Xylaria flabelliformis]|uniref:Fe2OG dioxygenase domain-containing protein n=1 Tax=Xylaria flabelliformis TaxID=2512241 RepID=A0A553HUP5_9PEZI|nr:hypothetical protein FHL15_007444 [Xylaria flabelliformis]